MRNIMKIKLFKSIAENIIKIFSAKIEQTPEEKIITEKFIEFLNVEDCIFCYKMMDEGFEPKDNLKKQLNGVMLNKVEKGYYNYTSIEKVKSIEPKTKLIIFLKDMDMNTENYDFFNIYHQHRNSHSDKSVISFLNEEQNKNTVYQYIHESLNLLKTEVLNNIDQFGFYHGKENERLTKNNNHLMYIVGVAIRYEIFTKEDTQQIRKLFEHIDLTMKDKLNKSDFGQSKAFRIIGKIYFDTFLESLKQYQANQLSANNNKENVLQQIKSFKARKKSLTETINHLVVNEEYSVENLPLNAKNKVKYITDLVNKIDSEEVSNFVQERLPIILKKYFSIDEEYRASLKNVEGLNATELMVQSLDNIERIVKAKQDDNNYDLLSELSVENRKLKVKNI